MYNKRCKLKILALHFLIPYLGKIIFLASDWTAASTKNPQHGSKQIRGIDASGLYASGLVDSGCSRLFLTPTCFLQ